MKKITISTFVAVVCCLFISITAFSQAGKKPAPGKFMENRKFKVQFYEMKATGRGKAVESMLTTKGGKIEADLMKDKLKIEEANFTILLDSTYTEDDAPMHLVKLEAFIEENKDEVIWEATVINYDIDGTVVQKKGGVDKKKFEFSGSEKTKK